MTQRRECWKVSDSHSNTVKGVESLSFFERDKSEVYLIFWRSSFNHATRMVSSSFVRIRQQGHDHTRETYLARNSKLALHRSLQLLLHSSGTLDGGNASRFSSRHQHAHIVSSFVGVRAFHVTKF